eukprot:TRINITY_DN1309_c6_g1_i1.p1 TRINITY_DN1309_c6_g1~~TRINITY_DN1309_c6_g1_i1.p1  ORF type:complete len:422 (-),score=128.04 TRINITY_DN1309_c6_g1_i1:16-1281(-)
MANNNNNDDNVGEGDFKFSQPFEKNGIFDNPWSDTWEVRGLSDLIKWQWNSQKVIIPPQDQLEKLFPVLKPNMELINNFHELVKNKNLSPTAILATWIGHSSFLVQMNKVNILTDPVFADRCSPISFIGPKRYREVPLTLDELPENIDMVLISHNHYDHLDISVAEHFGKMSEDKQPTYFVPYGMKTWCEDRGLKSVVELKWWENYQFNDEINCIFVPAQHWSKRSLFTKNETLWGGWVLESNRPNEETKELDYSSLFFCGDTGYCEVFKEFPQRFKSGFDMALLPIGAYCPRWFMRPQHINVEEAVTIHLDTKSRHSIGMHHGTFVLTDEPITEPRELLVEEAKKQNVDPENEFFTLNHGQSSLLTDIIVNQSKYDNVRVIPINEDNVVYINEDNNNNNNNNNDINEIDESENENDINIE